MRLFISDPTALIPQPGRSVTTFASGLVRVDQVYLGRTAYAATHREILTVGNPVPNYDTTPAIKWPDEEQNTTSTSYTEPNTFAVNTFLNNQTNQTDPPSQNPPIIITGQVFKAVVNKNFNYKPKYIGDVYNWMAQSMPSWVSLDGNTGRISGIPNETGNFIISLKAAGPGGISEIEQINIQVSGPSSLAIFPEVSEVRKDNGFTEYKVSAYGRSNDKGTISRGYSIQKFQQNFTVNNGQNNPPFQYTVTEFWEIETITYSLTIKAKDSIEKLPAAPLSLVKQLRSRRVTGNAPNNVPIELYLNWNIAPVQIQRKNFGHIDEIIVTYGYE